MPTGLIYSPRFLQHLTGPNHPERPARLSAVVDRLRTAGLWGQLVHLPFEPTTLQQLERVHHPDYIRRVEETCAGRRDHIDTPDSAICPASYEVACLAAGGAIAAADAVMAGTVTNAFCAMRPPGHHAEFDRSMGFCLFNSVAIAAAHLIAHHKLERVAIVDFDVHHGNGTQHTFEGRRDVLFISLHEDPSRLYPGTGYAEEAGTGDGIGFTLNVPMQPGSGDAAYREAMLTRVTPALERFEPQALLLSAGFDAAADDPLAHMEVTPAGFAWMSEHLVGLAGKLCRGRVISLLEGGYNLRSLAECVEQHVRVLLRGGVSSE